MQAEEKDRQDRGAQSRRERGYVAKTQQVILLWATALQPSNLRPEETQMSLRIRVSCCGQGSRHTRRWACPITRE